MSIEHSRALLLGSQASGLDQPTLRQRQEEALTTLRFDPSIPGAALTARVLLTTLRRLPGQLALDCTGLDRALVDELAATVATIDEARPLAFLDGPSSEASVQLDIGVVGEPGFIRAVPDGYGAQLANNPAVELNIGQPANALGSVLAVALAAAETFKHIVVDKEDRRCIHSHLSFCPVTLAADLTTAVSRAFSPLDIAIVGNGAIGTAIALILSELRLGGRVVLCDPETYGPENRGTYSLGGAREGREQPLKVDVVGDVLEAAGYEVVRVPEKSTELIKLIDRGELAAPRIVLTGLDTVEARRETQTLWPDHILDGATGDTSVGFTHAVPLGACLRCFFAQPSGGPDPVQQLAIETGLPASLLKRGDEALAEDDLDKLSAEQRERLRPFVGRPVCGLADALGLTDADSDGYLPSVPFVSQMAACLVVGRLLALSLDTDTDINFFQFDAFHGPVFAEGELRNPDASCFCQTRASVVEKARLTRWPPA